jgi:hypothetical protein
MLPWPRALIFADFVHFQHIRPVAPPSATILPSLVSNVSRVTPWTTWCHFADHSRAVSVSPDELPETLSNFKIPEWAPQYVGTIQSRNTVPGLLRG